MAPAAPPEAAAVDLRLTGEQTASALFDAIARDDPCDTVIAAAALLQVIEDAVQSDPLSLHRTTAYLRTTSAPSGVVEAIAATGAGVDRARRCSSRQRALTAAQEPLAALLLQAARILLRTPAAPVHAGGPNAPLGGVLCSPLVGDLLDAATRRMLVRAGRLTRDQLMRVPACFHDFDLHPRDLLRLADAYLERHGTGPVCVLGVRTSGSHLGPLLTAALLEEGAAVSGWFTHRPGLPLTARALRQLQDVAASDARILVIDDPPVSGRSIAQSIDLLTGHVARDRFTLALPVIGANPVPPARLAGLDAVLLPFDRWTVHERTTPSAVGRALSVLWPQLQVDTPCPAGALRVTSGGRGHVQVRYAVPVTDGTGSCETRRVLVEGAGLGLLGRHALHLADGLRGQVPTTYGLVDGLLFVQDLPDAPPPAVTANTVARYVATRASAFRVTRDLAGALRGRLPVWEATAELLAAPFGPASPVVRPLLLEPLTRAMTRTDQPSVIDGSTTVDRWKLGLDGEPIKTAFHDRAFSHLEVTSYDAVFDLAGATLPAPTGGGLDSVALRAAYQTVTGEPVDGERWMLYRLGQALLALRANELTREQADLESAAAVHEYLAARYLGGVGPSNGPVCALDLDGVLETDRLGYPATSPCGVLTLRALRLHGYRPLIVTGRSIGEARRRATTFGLCGALAEYGAAGWLAGDAEPTDLRPRSDRRVIERARELLREAGADLDPRYAHGIRVRRRPGGPDVEEVLNRLGTARGRLRVIAGDDQHDVTPVSVDKGTAVDWVLACLHGGSLALAVGDTGADLPMLRRADLALAPRNASAEVLAAGVRVTRRSYQQGLAQAAAELLGHAPGGCAACAEPRHTPRTRALLHALAVPEGGTRAVGLHIVRLGADVARSARWSG